MAERFTSKRLKFPKGKQKAFIDRVQKQLGLNLKSLSNLLRVSIRTLTDWKREKFLMSLRTAKMLSRKSGVKIPRGIKIRERFWYVNKGAKIGGLAVYKKYGYVGGNPKYRKQKWYEWWENEGRFISNPILQQLPIKKPRKSIELAEFTGIVLGDGGLSENQLTITLNYKDDKEYIVFVIRLIKKLFGISPAIYPEHKDSVDNIVISRKQLTKFLTQEIGLKKGNKIKNQVDTPFWIKSNKKFMIACVRGLVDTDGSVFTHSYISNGKLYHYKKLAFTSRSKPLLQSVYNILNNIGLNPRIAQGGRDVRLDSTEDMKRYFKLIGSHNPKHLKRYKK